MGDGSTPVQRAWMRCLKSGIRPEDTVEFQFVARSALDDIEEQHHDLLDCAQPHLQLLSRGVAGTNCVLMLLDCFGTVIRRYGRPDMCGPELASATRVGVTLDERCVGATAPSIVLAEGEPAVVFGGEHFCAQLDKFHCVAVPIEGLSQKLVGVLNVTTYGRPPAFDALSLAVDTVRSIESSIYRPSPDFWRFDFHIHPDWVGSPSGCVLLVDGDGVIVAANRQARAMLMLEAPHLPGCKFNDVFHVNMNRVFDKCVGPRSDSSEWRTAGGLSVYGRIEFGQAHSVLPRLSVDEVSPLHAATEQALHPSGEQLGQQLLANVEMGCIQSALDRVGGNVSSAARLLGISRHTIYRRLKSVALE